MPAAIARRLAHNLPSVAGCALLAVLAVVLLPSTAHAIGLFPSPEDIVSWVLNSFIKPPLEALLNQVWGILSSLTPAGVLTGSWGNMLGDSSTGTTVYSLANSVNDTLVKPIAYSVLAFGMIVQLIQIAGKADQDAAMPMLKELVLLALYYVIFRFLISHSSQLCEAVYTDINVITAGIGVEGLGSASLAIGELTDIGQAVVMLVCVGIVFLVALAAWVVTLFMAYCRAIQLYMFSAFAPIPLALLGIEQTRQYGVGFIKNFVALCLAGAIMMFGLFCFPTLVNTVLATGAMDTTFAATGLVTGPLMLVVLCLLLIFCMAKSGGIARSILGE